MGLYFCDIPSVFYVSFFWLLFPSFTILCLQVLFQHEFPPYFKLVFAANYNLSTSVISYIIFLIFFCQLHCMLQVWVLMWYFIQGVVWNFFMEDCCGLLASFLTIPPSEVSTQNNLTSHFLFCFSSFRPPLSLFSSLNPTPDIPFLFYFFIFIHSKYIFSFHIPHVN